VGDFSLSHGILEQEKKTPGARHLKVQIAEVAPCSLRPAGEGKTSLTPAKRAGLAICQQRIRAKHRGGFKWLEQQHCDQPALLKVPKVKALGKR
jgi:hypothetical protein